MKLSRKALVSAFIIVILGLSSVIAWTQLFTSKEVAVLETNMGAIEIELDRAKAPITVDNFVKYVKAGFYDGTIFHRVYDGFVIQGGGFTPDGVEKATNDPIKLESNNGLKNLAGTIAMARTDSPNTATSQFFINLVDNTGLDYVSESDPGYAVFGKVVSGMSVVNAIAKVPVGTRNVTIPDYGVYPFEMWPVQDVVITRAYMKP